MSSLTLPRENCLEEPKTVSFGFKFVTSLDELDELFRIPLTQVERRLHKIALSLVTAFPIVVLVMIQRFGDATCNGERELAQRIHKNVDSFLYYPLNVTRVG